MSHPPSLRYGAPEAITPTHRLDPFDCGKPALDLWLKTKALGNEGRASRTYVVTTAAGAGEGQVVGYYALATGAVALTDIPRKYRRSLPNPVGVMLLGRLAIDHRHHGMGIGKALLKRAFQQTLDIASIAGVRAMIVHAIDDEAAAFYERFGFQRFPPDTRTLFIPIETIVGAL